MRWVRRLLTDTDDDGRYRAGLGAVLGASFAILPLLTGVLEIETVLIATVVGAIVAAPFRWLDRQTPTGPVAVIAYAAFFLASVVVLRQLPSLAIVVFLGGFGFALGVLRYIGGWRNPVPPDPEPIRGPAQPALVLALVLPLLALVAVVVIGILVNRGGLR